MSATKIPYATQAWQLGAGCDQQGGPGCVNCWAARLASGRLKHLPLYRGLAKDGKWSGEIRVNKKVFEEPFHWRKPQIVFACPMTDFFLLPPKVIDYTFWVMGVAEKHTFLVVTHHTEALKNYFSHGRRDLPSNLYLLPTCETQERTDLMLPIALRSGARVVANLEPMLGAVDLSWYLQRRFYQIDQPEIPPISGIILGGESGPKARPMHPDWVRSVRDQCQAAGLPFYFKQWGEWAPEKILGVRVFRDKDRRHSCVGFEGLSRPPRIGTPLHQWPDGSWSCRVDTKRAGHLLDGREWREFPGHEGRERGTEVRR